MAGGRGAMGMKSLGAGGPLKGVRGQGGMGAKGAAVGCVQTDPARREPSPRSLGPPR